MMIKKLSNAYAPSAKEEEVRKIIIKELSDFYTDIKIDNLGNLIIHKPGKKKKIAITAPMDEVSFVVTHKKDDITLVATSVCPVKSNTLQNVSMIDKNKNTFILNKVPNLSANIEKNRNIEFIKTNNRKVKKLDTDYLSNSLIYNNKLIENDEVYIGKALERSICCSILCDIARDVANSIFEYYFIFTTQNYCDKKGAMVATYNIEIDELYNLCCVDTDNEEIESGNGPVIILRDKIFISNNELLSNFDNKTSLQKLISSNLICEGGIYQKQHTTKKIISIGIPIDFLGCFNEVVSKKDIDNFRSLILEKVLP